MSRRGRFPVVLAALLVAMWLLLNSSLAPGHILLAVILAIFFARTSRRDDPLRPSLRRFTVAVSLVGTVLVDVVRSNINVAGVVLRGVRGGGPGFAKVPLDLRHPQALAILAMILTATPGTVWVDLDRAAGQLTLHVLDLHDEEQWVRTIKQRYERPLMEIFQ